MDKLQVHLAKKNKRREAMSQMGCQKSNCFWWVGGWDRGLNLLHHEHCLLSVYDKLKSEITPGIAVIITNTDTCCTVHALGQS